MEYALKPIGHFSCEQTEPYHSPRQGNLQDNTGVVRLSEHCNFEQALQNLDGVSHLWLIYIFHQNKNWKPLVTTPRSSAKIGLFATRAPYRPNPIGMSCVKIEKVEGLNIFVRHHDLLNGTPILDIKPYLASADCITDSKIEWIDSLIPPFKFQETAIFKEQSAWLHNQGHRDSNLLLLSQFIENQLQYDPLNGKKKRLESSSSDFVLCYRTWRIHFKLIAEDQIQLSHIESGYTLDDLNQATDKYLDKQIHKEFRQLFII